jgi:hypothetical protein
MLGSACLFMVPERLPVVVILRLGAFGLLVVCSKIGHGMLWLRSMKHRPQLMPALGGRLTVVTGLQSRANRQHSKTRGLCSE